MLSILFVLAAVLSASAALPADRVEVEPCTYPDSSAAASAWRPVRGGEPVSLSAEKTPQGAPALAFPCDMSKLQERAYWDRQLTLDLARYSRIVFWIKLDGDTSAVAHCTLYFQSGDGWYGQGFAIPEDGWQRVVLDRGGFVPEDAPIGWGKITGIRLSFWKGRDRQATVLMGGMSAEATAVPVVRDVQHGAEGRTWTDRMTALLRSAGVDAGGVDSTDIEKGILEGKKIVVYPNNGHVTDAEAAALERFVRGGGKILACYGLPAKLAEILGLADADYVRPDRANQFAVMRFVGPPLKGMPREVKQASWNIIRARPASNNARVLADWYDGSGKPTGMPAVLLSDTGAFISHVVLDDDRDRKLQMLRALLGHFDPSIWSDIADGALRNAGTIGSRWRTLDEAVEGIRQLAASAGRRPDVERKLDAACREYARAQAAVRGGRHDAALQPAESAHEKLVEAFAMSQQNRPGEFRAVWCHSAYGVAGMTWDQAIAHLKRCGFTAVVPNMLWAGSADYPSELLPVTARCQKEGDQIQACLDACRKYGLQVHVWKVNWNLATAPDDFVAKLRAEGRLQRDTSGKEVRWLCPSHPSNFALERDSMLEVVRKYAVDGIHFDYIRYPDGASCYCDGCRQRFEATLGNDKVTRWPDDVLRDGPLHGAYLEFRRQNITRLVQAVALEARRIRPGIEISAAVFPNWPACRDEIGQDWAAWVRDGYLDFVCPMDYTASNREFRTRVQVQREAVAKRIPLYPGIGASAPGLDPVQVIEQILIAREEGVPGFIIFEYNSTTAAEHLPTLRQGISRER